MFSEFRKHESCFTATFARRKTLRYRPIATRDCQILRDAGESKPTEKSFPVHFLLSGAISPHIRSVRSDASRNPAPEGGQATFSKTKKQPVPCWIPAFAGMTVGRPRIYFANFSSTALPTQIRLPHQIIAGKLFGAPFQDDRAGFQDVPSVRNRERHRGVLFHQQDGHAGSIDRADIL